MSTTNKTSRIILFVMIVISLVFFITSFMAAALTNNSQPSIVAQEGEAVANNCILVRTGEKLMADCTMPD